jgi:hypothetical protein
LIQRKDNQRQRDDAPIRFPKNELSVSHKHQFQVSNFKFQANLCLAPPRSRARSRFLISITITRIDDEDEKEFPFVHKRLLSAHGVNADFSGWLQPVAQLAGTGPRPAAPFGTRAQGIDPRAYALSRRDGHARHGFFDGAGAPAGTPKPELTSAVEVLFSRAGQTADQMIERAAHRFSDYGEVLVVTDDRAERDVVGGLGSSVAGCANFIRMIGDALTELQDELRNHNRAEANRFKRPPRRNLK